jgi:hypothetical protein
MLFSPPRTRRPHRLWMVHPVLAKLKGRGWVSAQQVWLTTYYGTGSVHRQTRKRVTDILDRYVEAGLIERNSEIARCVLYRHLTNEDGVDEAMVREFQAHANQRRRPSDEVGLMLIDHALDLLVPRDVDPARFLSDGSVITSMEPAVAGSCL